MAARNRLRDIILQKGAISFAEYMGICNAHYYGTRDPFGKKGDFTTAPEISQMFGEILAAWVMQTWQDVGSPAAFHLIELGAGRGTLMADILRTVARKDDFMKAVHIHLVETSQILVQEQKDILKYYDVSWHDVITDISVFAPVIIIGNEFFDALPVHQFIRHHDHWHERGVTLDETGELVFCDIAPSFDPRMLESEGEPHDGDILEYSPISHAIAGQIADMIDSHNGAGLFIDYGYLKSTYGDTVQALSRHKPVSPLKNSGNIDITYHIDFQRLENVFLSKKLNTKTTIQGMFLKRLGMGLRAKRLVMANPACAKDIELQYDRLTGDHQMGQLFKVLGVSRGETELAGFDNVYS